MLSRLTLRSRPPQLRPLRPPSATTSTGKPKPRLFTQNTQLLLVSQRVSRTRPQLPYLAQPAFRPPHTTYIQGQVIRLLSTETRQFVKEQAWVASKWTLILWTFLLLGFVAYKGIQLEISERRNPTPDEWRFWSRQALRNARAFVQQAEHFGFVDWAQVASNLKTLVDRLEDPSIDGKDVLEREDGGLLIPGVGKAGYDISSKSWPWRACYFEAIMGCAAAAEHLDNMVLDKTRNMVFAREYVVGPSNPDPRPVPGYMHAAPREEDCNQRAFDPPETFYLRVLTGAGFTTKQKLDAAFAYGNWLEFKGLKDSAKEVYNWGVDIATAGVEGDSSSIIDGNTSVLKVDGDRKVTSNLLEATTQLAIHNARTGNVAAALPIFLSVLRARRAAPLTSGSLPRVADERDAPHTDIGTVVSFVKKLLGTPPFPAQPVSGDLPYTRPTDKPTCEESELMLYIGEILFATSGATEGIGWTRQAVTIAEAQLMQPSNAASAKEANADSVKCKECLTVGVINWEQMLYQLSAQAAAREGSKKSGWFGTKTAPQNDTVAEELAQVSRLKARIIREGIDQQLSKQRGSGTFLG